jgi:hypothetical protein
MVEDVWVQMTEKHQESRPKVSFISDKDRITELEAQLATATESNALNARHLAQALAKLIRKNDELSEARKVAEMMEETLEGIAKANYREWDELAEPEEFVKWAQSRARNAINAPREVA